MGLLFLRLAAAGTAMVQGYSYFAVDGAGSEGGYLVGIALILSGLLLLAGFLTPLVCSLLCVLVGSTGAGWIGPPPDNLFDKVLPTALTAVIAISVTILGPGGYSVDSRLFGRREIIIPRLPPTS